MKRSLSQRKLLELSCTLMILIASMNTADSKRTCRTSVPGYSERRLDQARMQLLPKMRAIKQQKNTSLQKSHRSLVSGSQSCEELCRQCIEIETYFHLFTIPVSGGGFVVPHPTSIAYSFSTVSANFTTIEEVNLMIDRQMIVLNDAYSMTPFRFKLINRNNASVSTNVKYTNFAQDYHREMSAEYGVGNLDTLNVFLSFSVKSRNDTAIAERGETVAFASFPSYQQERAGDGVFLRFDCLPGGGFIGTDRGYTLVHEVGHWFGLFHTFQNSITTDPKDFGVARECSPDNENDFVADTVVVAGPTHEFVSNCSDLLSGTELDTCPTLPGNDQVFNFMNYISDESCYEGKGEFTCGQIERMNLQWELYRDRVEKCDAEIEIEIEIFIKFDKIWHIYENLFYLEDEEGRVIFNSTRDHLACAVAKFQDALLVDLCRE